MIAGTLQIEMSANLARLGNDMHKAKSTVERSMKGIEGAVASAKAALGALGIGVGIGYFVSLINGTIEAMDRLNDLSKTTDISVEKLAGLALAAKQSGGDLESAAQSISKLSVNIGKEPEKFAKLGITAKEPLEAFKQLADVFVAIKDPQLRAAVAAEALGKSWAGAAPLLSEGSKKIQEMVDKGTRLSGMTKEAAEQADQFNDQMAELNTTLGATRTRLVGDMLPGLTDVAKAMSEAAKEGGALLAVWVAIGAAVSGTMGLGQQLRFGQGTQRQQEIRRLEKDLKALQQSQENVRGSMAAGIMARQAEEIGQIRARLELLRHEEQLLEQAKQKTPAADPAAAAAAAVRAKAFLDDKKNAEDVDATYRGLLKTLKEKLLIDHELTEVNKLQLALDALGAKQRATITPTRKTELESLAKEIDGRKTAKAALEAYVKEREAEAALKKEIDEHRAAEGKKIGDAILATDKQIEQIQFETTLISLSNEEREVAIALRTMETSGIDKQSAAYWQLGERLRAAIAEKTLVEKNKKAADEITEFWKQAARSMQQSMSSFFFDIMQGNLNDLAGNFKRTIDQIVANMLAAKAATALFGPEFAKGTGNIGGLVGSALSWLTGGINLHTAWLGAPEFAGGGEFSVGGMGGTDSQLVAFRATPGERVSVATPAQQRSEEFEERTFRHYATLERKLDMLVFRSSGPPGSGIPGRSRGQLLDELSRAIFER